MSCENIESAFASSFAHATAPRWQRKAMAALASPQADRFIPNRTASSIEESHYQLTAACDAEEACSPAKQDFQRAMAACLFPDNGNKVLAFSQQAPKAGEGYQADARVMYSQAKAAGAGKSARHIAQTADRILDAPELKSDFYLNPIDWSSSNVVAVALGSTVYLWNAASGSISELCSTATDDYVSSVSWLSDGVHVAVGTNSATVQIWDAQRNTKVRTMTGHAGRVGALAWNEHILSSGSRSGAIINSDVRVSAHAMATLQGHTQEVCGLRWSADGRQLASGANDNIVNIWNGNGTVAQTLTQHTGAVKALAWCPWQPSLLATGGGAADHHIRFWNANTGACVNAIDAKSQVSGLVWNAEHREIVSSHGFAQNQLTVWRYPTLTKAAELTGHTGRVTAMCASPDGQTVLSAGADETLRFWKCFATDGAKKAARAAAPAPSRLSAMIR